MIENIYAFLTGDNTILSLYDLITNSIVWLFKLILNIGTIFLNFFFYSIELYFPDISFLYPYASYFYNILLPYCVFIKDMIFLPDWAINYIIVSFIARIMISHLSITRTIALKIYNKLKP